MTNSTLAFGSDDYLSSFASSKTTFNPRSYINRMVEQMSRYMTRDQRVVFQEKGGAGYVYMHLPNGVLSGDFDQPYGRDAKLDYDHLFQCDCEAGLEHTPHQPAKTMLGRVAERLFYDLAIQRSHRERWERAHRLNALRWQLEARTYAAILHALNEEAPAANETPDSKVFI